MNTPPHHITIPGLGSFPLHKEHAISYIDVEGHNLRPNFCRETNDHTVAHMWLMRHAEEHGLHVIELPENIRIPECMQAFVGPECFFLEAAKRRFKRISHVQMELEGYAETF